MYVLLWQLGQSGGGFMRVYRIQLHLVHFHILSVAISVVRLVIIEIVPYHLKNLSRWCDTCLVAKQVNAPADENEFLFVFEISCYNHDLALWINWIPFWPYLKPNPEFFLSHTPITLTYLQELALTKLILTVVPSWGVISLLI